MSARWTFLMLAPLLALSLLSSPSNALDNKKKTGRDWEYLDNGVVRIGIDK